VKRFKLWLAQKLLPEGCGYRIVRHLEESEIGIQKILAHTSIDDESGLDNNFLRTGPAMPFRQKLD